MWKIPFFSSTFPFEVFRINMASPSLCLMFLPLLMSLGCCLWPVTAFVCFVLLSLTYRPWRTCKTSDFSRGCSWRHCCPGNTPQGNCLEQDLSFSTQWEGAVLCPLPWVLAKLQSRGSCLHRNVSPSLVTASRACASCGGEGREVCSHSSARVSPSMAPSWKSCHSRGTWHPTSQRDTAGSGIAPSFPSSTAFTESMAQYGEPYDCRRKEKLACMSLCLLGPQHPGLITLPFSVLSWCLYCFSSALSMLI